MTSAGLQHLLTFIFIVQIIATQISVVSSHEECGNISVQLHSNDFASSPTVYNEKLGKCVIKIGSLCKPGGNATCPPNAECPTRPAGSFVKFNSCKCKDGYVKDDSWEHCGKIVGYGEACQDEGQGGEGEDTSLICDVNSGSKCLNGTCQCLSQDYDQIKKRCKLLVGEICFTKDAAVESKLQCPDHATCEYGNPHYNCVCDKGYLATDRGGCGAIPGTKCDDDNPCFNVLECADGQCICPGSMNQIFDGETKSCLNQVGTACGDDSKNCTKFAECSVLSNRCECQEGFIETPQWTCIPNHNNGRYNEACKAGSCNARKGLACIQAKCQCVVSNLVYTDGDGCAAPSGDSCGLMGPPSGARCNKGTEDCRSYLISCVNSNDKCLSDVRGFWYCTSVHNP